MFSVALWRHRFASTLPHETACCLTAPSHYLSQCWLIVNKIQQHTTKAIWEEKSQPSVTKISLKMTYSKFHPIPQGLNNKDTIKQLCITCTENAWNPLLGGANKNRYSKMHVFRSSNVPITLVVGIRLPARWAFDFFGDHQQNIQCVLIHRCSGFPMY